MAVRVISSIVGFPFLAAIVVLGGIYLKLGLILVSMIGMYEFYNAVSKKIMPIHFIGFAMASLYLFFIDINLNSYYRLALLGAVILCLLMIIFCYPKYNIFDVSVTLMGFFYIAFLLGNIFLLRIHKNGQYIVWLPFICAWCSDTGAYFIGCNFGKHKLAPVLSPKKSIEGAIGGVVSAALGGALFGFAVFRFFPLEESSFILGCAFIGGIGAVFGQLGDLVASSIKRFTNIKDFGKIMPGHGGVLDRFDSVLFTAPIVYILSELFMS